MLSNKNLDKIKKTKKYKPQSYLILKNVFKSVFKNKVQIFGLIILIFLSSLIFTIMNTTTNRVQNSYDNIVKKSNLHDFIIDDKLIKRNIYQNDINIFDDFNYKQQVLEKIKTEQIKNDNGFDWEFKDTKLIFKLNKNNEGTLFKTIMTDPEAEIDKLVIYEGDTIRSENEIVMSYEFAKANNYKLNDYICLQSDSCDKTNPANNALKIVGFGNSAEYIYPQVDISTPIPNQKHEALIYVHPAQFGYNLVKYNKKIDLGSLPSEINNVYINFESDRRAIRNKKIKAEIVSKIQALLEIFDPTYEPPKDGEFSEFEHYKLTVLNEDGTILIDTDSEGEDQLTDLSKDKNFKVIIRATKEDNINNPIQGEQILTIKLINRPYDQKSNLKNFKHAINNVVFNIDIGNYQQVSKVEIETRVKLIVKTNMIGFTGNWNVTEGKDYNLTISNNGKELLPVNNVSDSDFQLQVNIKTKASSSILANQTKDPINLYLKKNFKSWDFSKKLQKIDVTSKQELEPYFVAKWHQDNKKKDFSIISDSLKKYFTNNTNSEHNVAFQLGDSAYRFAGRTNVLHTVLRAYKITTVVLLIITIIISLIIILLITKKRVENSKAQIGVLKSLGYSSKTIAIGYLVYPLLASLIGGILGYLVGSILQIPIINVFSWYFAFYLKSFSFDVTSLIFSTVILFIILAIFSTFSFALYISGSPLKLIHTQEGNRTLWLTKAIAYINRGKKFDTRFRGSIFSKSIGKVFTIFFVMFLSTILMTISVVMPKSLYDMKVETYRGVGYRSVTEYETPISNSPLSFYSLYNPENRIKNINDIEKNIEIPSSSFYSKKVMKKTEDGRYEFDGESLMRMGNLSYSMLDLNFYLNSKLIDIDGVPNSGSKIFKPITCSLAIPNWSKLTPDEQERYSLADCLLQGPIQNAPYFVKNKLENLVNSLYTLDYLFAKIALKDLQNDVKTNNNSITLEEYNQFLNNLEKPPLVANDLKDKTRTIFARRSYYARKHIFPEIIKRLNNKDSTTGKYNRYTAEALDYFYQINKSLGYDKVFNIQFGTIPFNPLTDELATFFEPEIKAINYGSFNSKKVRKLNFKAYGISQDTRMHILQDQKGNNLIETMYQSNPEKNVIPVIINQSLSKIMKIDNGDELKVDPNRNLMYSNKTKDKIDNNKWNIYGQPGDIWDNISHPDIALGEYGPVGLYDYFNGTMAKLVNNGEIYIDKEKRAFQDLLTFKVIGIQQGYGDPKMFLQKEKADVIMGFSDGDKKGPIHKNRLQMIKVLLGKEKVKEINAKFGDNAADNEFEKYMNKIFPPFNAKFSKHENIKDITDGISTTSAYGDFSKNGLDGLRDPNDSTIEIIKGSAKGAIYYALPIAKHQSVLDEITGISESALYAFALISIFISLMIILVTSNLIISENIRLISTMKVIGYNNIQITKVTMGIYLPIILVSFLIGFPTAWFTIGSLINLLSNNTTWIMPFYFSWWIVFAVFAVIIGIYLFSFLIGWFLLKKVNLVEALKVEN